MTADDLRQVLRQELDSRAVSALGTQDLLDEIERRGIPVGTPSLIDFATGELLQELEYRGGCVGGLDRVLLDELREIRRCKMSGQAARADDLLEGLWRNLLGTAL